MDLRKLLKINFTKASAVMGLSLLSLTNSNAQTNVTVDGSAEWLTGVICYDNPSQGYLWYAGDFPLDALKTEVNATDDTVTLYPNYNTYGDGTDAYWANGTMGNKYLMTLSYVSGDQLVGQNFTFSGNVTSFTLASGYTAKAFVKIMDATFANTIAEITANLTETGNFTIPYNATNIPADSHIQYGFQVYGLNANPAFEEQYGNVVIAPDEAGEVEEPGDVTVTVDATQTHIGYVNVFENNAGQAYLWGSAWGVPDLKSVVNTDSNTIDLFPNYNLYGTGDDPTYWTNGDVGNKIVECSTYIEDNTLLGQTVTFEGNTISNTLASGFNAQVFIKVMDGGYQLLEYLHEPLVGGTEFSLTSVVGNYPNAAHVQYGFSVTGLNGNPASEAANGFARVGASTTSVNNLEKGTAVIYPNPANSLLNISAEGNIENIQIYNAIGQTVFTGKPNQNTTTVNVSGFTSGVYILNTVIDGKSSSTRFIKQ